MYCNILDVRRRLPEVTAETISDSTIKYYIEDAQSLIDGYINEIYDVPFSTTPDIISNLCALYTSYLTLTNYPDAHVEEDLERMWNSIHKQITDLITGKLSLGSAYELGNPANEPYFTTTRSEDYNSTITAPDDRNWYTYSTVGE